MSERRLLPQAGLLLLMLFQVLACESGSSNTQTKEPAAEANQEIVQDTKTQKGADFLLDAYSYGLMLSQYSKLAVEKAQTPAVKSIAEQSGAWYENLNKEIKQLAAQHALTLPATPGSDVQSFVEELKALPPDAFEQRYLEVVQEIHQKTISLYTGAAGKATDTQLQQWATQKVPELEAHAQAVQELLKQLKAQ